MLIGQIIEGTYNNITNRKEELSLERMAICKKCKLYLETAFSPICNSSLFINPDTKAVSSHEKKDYVRGCGCILNSKTRVQEAKCPGNKW